MAALARVDHLLLYRYLEGQIYLVQDTLLSTPVTPVSADPSKPPPTPTVAITFAQINKDSHGQYDDYVQDEKQGRAYLEHTVSTWLARHPLFDLRLTDLQHVQKIRALVKDKRIRQIELTYDGKQRLVTVPRTGPDKQWFNAIKAAVYVLNLPNKLLQRWQQEIRDTPALTEFNEDKPAVKTFLLEKHDYTAPDGSDGLFKKELDRLKQDVAFLFVEPEKIATQ